MKTLTFPQLVPDIVTGHFIRIEFVSLNIEQDFELVLTLRQVFVNQDDVPLLETLKEGKELSTDQIARLQALYRSQIKTVSTRGSRIDAKTGADVELQENGEWPEGSIWENQQWIGVPADMVPGKTVFEKVSAMILEAMKNMTIKGRI